MFRRPIVVRRGPGLLGTMARTAVIAGTATAVSGAVARRTWGQRPQQAAQAAPPPAVDQGSPAPEASPSGGEDRVSQLERLAELQRQGVLTPEEFAAEKARILQS